MIDESKRIESYERKEKVRKRMRVQVDPDNYEYIPGNDQSDFYNNDRQQKVGIYVRVSTNDIHQTTSFELQQKYYEEFISKRPNWKLIKIYADEGKSGTETSHRPGFNEMIADAKSKKIDLIITKSVSRFARNIITTIGTTRDLAEMNPPVGVFFESECVYTLNDESQMSLSFLATMAEEESHTRSRSMESSLRMRLDNGIPLTPKLYGYMHDSDGNLIINPQEAPTVKLIFYMYLFGYSTPQIAQVLNALDRKTYYGKEKWSSSVIVQILRNERHCGDVLTRKTYTVSYRTHKKRKNDGIKPQSMYRNHHEAIISRDDYIACQRLLDNSKYGAKSFLPELKVIDDGLLKGFVIINPRWAGFKEKEYLNASLSTVNEETSDKTSEVTISVEPGDFDFREFQIVRSELFEASKRPNIRFNNGSFQASSHCIRKLSGSSSIELLINPIAKKLAIRSTDAKNKNAIQISRMSQGEKRPKSVSTAAFGNTLFSLLGWNTDYRYKVYGELFEQNGESVFIFNCDDAVAYINPTALDNVDSDPAFSPTVPLIQNRNRVKAVPTKWMSNFGKPFYLHEQTLKELAEQKETDWQLRLEGQLFEVGKKLNVTSFEELKEYISSELSEVSMEELNE